MADYPRHAKTANMWFSGDLAGFNIEVVFDNDPQSFFGVSEPPTPQHISPIIWNNSLPPTEPLSKEEKTFFFLLKDTMYSPADDHAASNDFIHFLLGYLGYDNDATHILHTRQKMGLLVCGEHLVTTSDVAILETSNGGYDQFLMLVQQDTCNSGESPEPYAPLIAKAIAAFRINNAQRQYCGPPLKSQTFPAITIFGTSVVFYKITVTQALADAVMDGIFPDEKTIVYKFHPRLNMLYRNEGMVTVENRRLLLKYLEAFKQFVADPNREELIQK